MFIVYQKIPSKINSASDPNLIGTTKYPIQLVQSGNDFITMQQLQSPQVTQIAKMLEETRGVKDPSIIYQDKSNNRKLVYKIINKDNARAVARNASAASAASVALPSVIQKHPPSSRLVFFDIFCNSQDR